MEMNQITEAFMQAGVKVPSTMQRMWTVIKEEGPSTAAQLRKRLPLVPYGTIGSKLHEMEQRGMIYSRGTKAPTKFGKSAVKEYLTDMDKYELLPLPSKTKREKSRLTPGQTRALDTLMGMAPAEPQAKPAVVTTHQPPSVEHLTIAQARELWLVLDKMFGGRK